MRGLARGFGSDDRVASPTFTISKVYKAGAREIQHFDFYRLHDAGLVAFELHDAIEDPQTVVAVEWGDIVSGVLPDRRLTILIRRTGDDTRELEITFPTELGYLTEGIS